MIADFVFSKKGQEFLQPYIEKFTCDFFIAEPGGIDVILDTQDLCYRIPENERLEDFMKAIEESMRSGKNIMVERYEPIELYDTDDIY